MVGSLNIFFLYYERATKAQQEHFCLNVKSFHGNGKGMDWYFSGCHFKVKTLIPSKRLEPLASLIEIQRSQFDSCVVMISLPYTVTS